MAFTLPSAVASLVCSSPWPALLMTIGGDHPSGTLASVPVVPLLPLTTLHPLRRAFVLAWCISVESCWMASQRLGIGMRIVEYQLIYQRRRSAKEIVCSRENGWKWLTVSMTSTCYEAAVVDWLICSCFILSSVRSFSSTVMHLCRQLLDGFARFDNSEHCGISIEY